LLTKNLTGIAAILCASFFLSACAGRQANTVAAIQPGDDTLTCDQIVATLKLNTITVKDLMGESSSTTGKNVAAGVAGAIIFFPALFFMDVKNAAGDEARALVRRNEVLFKRHQLLKCEPKLEDKNTAEIFLYWDQDKPKNADAK
jgi:hypothetical protein